MYVSVGGVVACLKPSAFSWFVKAAPASYSASLGLIMLAMGLTLELKDFLSLFWQRPLSVCPFLLLNCLFIYLFSFNLEMTQLGIRILDLHFCKIWLMGNTGFLGDGNACFVGL